MASEHFEVDGILRHWLDGTDDAAPGGYFEIRTDLTGAYSSTAAEGFFRKVVANGKRVRLIIELPEEE